MTDDRPPHPPRLLFVFCVVLSAQCNLLLSFFAPLRQLLNRLRLAFALVHLFLLLLLVQIALSFLGGCLYFRDQLALQVLRVVADGDDCALVATGSEVSLALTARELLAAEGISARVISMPSWELFGAQPAEYRDGVLPPSMPARVGVEAASPFGWERWTGTDGRIVAIDRFGESAPGGLVMSRLGVTPEAVARAAAESLAATRAR